MGEVKENPPEAAGVLEEDLPKVNKELEEGVVVVAVLDVVATVVDPNENVDDAGVVAVVAVPAEDEAVVVDEPNENLAVVAFGVVIARDDALEDGFARLEVEDVALGPNENPVVVAGLTLEGLFSFSLVILSKCLT